jgi:hypothetical protein
MVRAANRFAFSSKVVVYPGVAAWRFLGLPGDLARRIRAAHGKSARGWGSLPILARIGNTEWRTSIFPDRQSGSYLLPLKRAVRAAEGIADGAKVAVSFEVAVGR